MEKKINVIIAKNEWSCVKLEDFGGEEIRVVFYDSDNKYFDDWAFDYDSDISVDIEVIKKVYSYKSIEDFMDWLNTNFGYPRICYNSKELPLKDLFSIARESKPEDINRFGDCFFVYDEG